MSPVERMVNAVDVKPREIPADFDSGGLPYVTHEGILKIGDIEIPVVVLNTGQRLLTGDFVESLVKELHGITLSN